MQTDRPGSLSEKFGDFGAAPTDQLWNSIAASLDQKEQKKRGAFWWWFTGIAAALLVIFSVYQVGYHFGKNDMQSTQHNSSGSNFSSETATGIPGETNDNLSENNTVTKQLPDEEVTSSQPLLNEDSEKETVHNSDQRRHTTDVVVKNQDNDTELAPLLVTERDASNEPGEMIMQTQDDASSGIAKFDVKTMPAAETKMLAVSNGPLLDLKAGPLEKRKSDNEWELGFAVGTLVGYQSTNQTLIVPYNQPQNLTTDFESGLLDVNSITGSASQAPVYNIATSKVETSVKRPLSVELSIARTFGRRWSLGSGVGLNYFAGQNVYTTPSEMETRCNFLSVSVPLVVDFDFVKRRRFEVSAGSGIISEFPFLVNSETISADPATAKKEEQQISKGYMGSVLLRTGVAYRLNEHLKIGLSPNMRYYFHQSLQSEIPVLKRDLWAGLSLGATWTF
jgi:hypothetical protein